MISELVEIVAREQFNGCNDCSFDDQTDYIKAIWKDRAMDTIDNYNTVSDILKNVGDRV